MARRHLTELNQSAAKCRGRPQFHPVGRVGRGDARNRDAGSDHVEVRGGEPENRGAILDAPLGKGRYVYTTLSIFRQVPAGVPGAVRILVNLMSAGIVPPQR